MTSFFTPYDFMKSRFEKNNNINIASMSNLIQGGYPDQYFRYINISSRLSDHIK